jgi:uncharacterized Tic20 family protein
MNISAQPSSDEKQWAMLAHLSALLLYFTVIGGLVVPLVIWQAKKDTMPFVADQAKETLNFQITIILALIVAGVLCWILIGIPLLLGLVLFHFIITIVAAVKSGEGVRYRYPFCWRVIS